MNHMFFWPWIFAIPLVAIVGGITASIVRTVSRHRIIELAQRERIAAIERGIDPSKLSPLPVIDMEDGIASTPADFARLELRRSQGLLVGGIVTTAVGLALGIMIRVTDPNDNGWIVGIVPFAVGLALLLCARIVRPKAERGGHGGA